MDQSFDTQLILAVAIVLVAIVAFGYVVYARIAAVACCVTISTAVRRGWRSA